MWCGEAPRQAQRPGGGTSTLSCASPSLVAFRGQQQALEDRLGNGRGVHLVRPALNARLELLHFGHRTVLGRERWGAAREAPSTVASRARHPGSRYISDVQHRHMSLIVLRRTTVDGVVARCHAAAPRGADRMRRAKTTMRLAAEYSGWHAERISRS